MTERAQGVARPFGEVREQMRAALRKRAQREKKHAYLDGLKHKARLRIDEAAPAGITPPPWSAPRSGISSCCRPC